MTKRTLCIIMGGGKGTRMYPLTKYRSKPAVPLGAKYRLIDVPISNCLNSGYNRILVLTQYNSQSLNKHISRTYRFDTFSGGFVEVLAASQSYESTEWFQGTADSVRQTLPHITSDPSVDEIIVLSGDQLYTMDLQRMHKFHHDHKADVTVACHPIAADETHRFGIMSVDKKNRITSFFEKPKDLSIVKDPPLKIGGRDHYLANMGIYVFSKEVLREILTASDKDDFGKEIIPDAISAKKVCAYTFSDYWSDIGTIGSYYAANIMMTAPRPPFDVYNEDWPFYTRSRHLPPAKIQKCRITQSIIAEGGLIDEAEIERSIIGIRSRIGKKTRIIESMLAGNDFYESPGNKKPKGRPALGIGSDCVIQKAIVDKNVCVGNRVKIINKENVREAEGKGYTIRDGVVVVHKGSVISDGTVI